MKILGIALEEPYCRVAVVEHTKQRFYCKAIKSIPYQPVQSDAIEYAFERMKLLYQKGCRVSVGISDQHIITCNLTLDADLRDHQVMQFLSTKAISLFGYPANQLCIDYDNETHGEQGKQNIRVAATHRQFITRIKSACKQFNMPLHVIESNGAAKARLKKISNEHASLMTVEDNYATAVGLALRTA